MLSVSVPCGATLERINFEHFENFEAGGKFPDGAVWLDLHSPTPAENKLVERTLGIALPTREEMQEIEVTSRLYVENGARFMTATLMCHSDTDVPRTTPVTFILSGHRLVTMRYDEPKPFAIVGAKLTRLCPPNITGETVLMDLLDAVIDRAADILEKIGSEVDAMKWAKDQRAAIKGMQRDVQSLSDHATYLSQKISFLLDAMLGVVSLEQNNIIKIFSVAAVVFMPPTLIASIYGMNFKHMPELEFDFGYPLAIVLMLLAAVLPYFFFRWMKWL